MLPAILRWPRPLGRRERMELPRHFQYITTALHKTRRKRRSSSSFRSWPLQPWFHFALWLLVPERPREPGLGTLGVLPPVDREGGWRLSEWVVPPPPGPESRPHSGI